MNRREVLAGSFLFMLIRPSGSTNAAVPFPPASLQLDGGAAGSSVTTCSSMGSSALVSEYV